MTPIGDRQFKECTVYHQYNRVLLIAHGDCRMQIRYLIGDAFCWTHKEGLFLEKPEKKQNELPDNNNRIAAHFSFLRTGHRTRFATSG